MRTTARAFLLAFAATLLLAGCVVNTSGSGQTTDAASLAPATDASGKPLIEQPAANAPGAPGEVDYSCTTDADCVVKNVGNCCGEYPACVNVDSATFPEQVKAECAKNDMMAVCGYPDIAGCQCVENRCQAGPATDGEAVR